MKTIITIFLMLFMGSAFAQVDYTHSNTSDLTVTIKNIDKFKGVIMDNYESKYKVFNADKTHDRKVDELIGVCRGVTANGSVVRAEADYLITWLESNIANSYQTSA